MNDEEKKDLTEKIWKVIKEFECMRGSINSECVDKNTGSKNDLKFCVGESDLFYSRKDDSYDYFVVMKPLDTGNKVYAMK